MKVILLILGILILFSKKSEVANIFKSEQKIKEQIIKSLKDSQKVCKEVGIDGDASLLFIGLLISSVYGMFYFLSVIYIDTFWFTTVSILLIFDSVRVYVRFINTIKDVDSSKQESRIYRVINLVVDCYLVWFVFNHIYLYW